MDFGDTYQKALIPRGGRADEDDELLDETLELLLSGKIAQKKTEPLLVYCNVSIRMLPAIETAELR